MSEAALFALVDAAEKLADDLRRRFDDVCRRGPVAFKIVAEGRKVSIACGRDDDRRGGAMAARGAAATLRIEVAGDDLFFFSIHARSRRGLRPVPARAGRERVGEVVDGFVCDCREREAAPAARSRYDPCRQRSS